MPNRDVKPRQYPYVPLDEHLGYATHVEIECQSRQGSVRICSHTVTMRTEQLYAAAPGAVTVADFELRLFCRWCQRRGSAKIRAARR